MISVGIAFTPKQLNRIDGIRLDGMADDELSRSELVRLLVLFALNVIDHDDRAVAEYQRRREPQADSAA